MDEEPTGDQSALAILVLGDDLAERRLLLSACSRAGLPASGACTADAAAQLARGPAAVVLCAPPADPALDALRALQSLPRPAGVPLLLVTDRQGPGTPAVLDAGADDHLTRPLDVAELVARLRARLRAGETWSRFVQGEQRTRAAVTAILRQAPAGRTPEATAETVCTELVTLPEVGGAAVVAFRTPDQALTLAAAGTQIDGLCPGSRATVATSRRLRRLAERSVVGGTEATGRPATSTLAGTDGAVVASALIRGRGVEGLLLARGVDTDRPAGADHALARLRSVVNDVAAVCDALLGPVLAGWEELALQRSELLLALAARTFSPTFQPIVELGSGRAVGYELLTRFDDGAEPQRRFAEAAAVGMGVALERATMATGVAAAVTLPEDAFLSLNVSPSFLLERTGVAVAELARACDRRIVLEITEHDPIEDYGALLSAVEDLGIEVQLSVDDAGAGYASLHHILALHPSYVKLDQTWIAGIDRDPARQALIAGLRYFAGRTSCRLIAEGIETEAELATLRALDVQLGQGFLLGRPAPVPAA